MDDEARKGWKGYAPMRFMILVTYAVSDGDNPWAATILASELNDAGIVPHGHAKTVRGAVLEAIDAMMGQRS